MTSRDTANLARELGDLLARYRIIPVDINEGEELSEISFVLADAKNWDEVVTLDVFTDPETGVVTVSPR